MTADRRRRGLRRFSTLPLALVLGCGQLPRTPKVEQGDAPRKVKAHEVADMQVALGRSLESEGDREKAEVAYREALKRDPKSADAHPRLAVLLDKQGKFEEASPHYESALKARPGDADIFCDRGYSLALQGRAPEAETALRQAIALKPDHARAHNNLGLLLGRTGKPEQSLAEFRKAGLSDSDAHLNLAFALGQDRKWPDARKHIALARAAGIADPAVDSDVKGLETLLGRAESTAPTLDATVVPAAGVTSPSR